MKTLLLILTALALWQHWDKLDRWLNPPQASSASGEIVLYATSWCGYCAKTRELLQSDGIAYREVDIEKDAVGRRQYDAIGGRGIPVLDMHGKIIQGYNPTAIRAAY